MKRKPYVLISVATRCETASWDFGRQFLEALRQTDERLVPEFVANTEPIKTPFEGIQACEKLWAPVAMIQGPGLPPTEMHWNFMWKRSKSVKNEGQVLHTSVNKFGKMKLGQVFFRAEPDRKADWLSLLRRLCAFSQPKFAMLHFFTGMELAKAPFGSPESSFQIGPVGITLEKGIPNLGWANYFGDELAAEIDIERLKAQGFAPEQIGKGYLVTVTDSLFNVSDDFAKFSSRRSVLKELFRDDLFQIKVEPQELASARTA